MNDPHDQGDSAPAPTQPPARTGEGAQTALLALIRKRKLQVDGYEPEAGDGTQAPPPK